MIRSYLLSCAVSLPLVLAAGCSPNPPAPPFVDPISTNNSIQVQLSSNSMVAGGMITATISQLGNAGMQCGAAAVPTVTGPTPPTGAPSTLIPVSVTGTSSPFTLAGTLAGTYTVSAPLVGVILTGNAKWGSTVTVSGGAMPVTTVADPYSGRWEASVCLNPTTANSLSVTATDGAGTSQATAVNITAPATTAPAVLTVTPAAAMPPTLQIQTATSQPPGTTVAMATANQQLVYAYTVTDMFGNQLQSNNVTVTSNMPSSMVGAVDTQYVDTMGNTWYQGNLVNFVQSGTWTIAAHVAGTTQTSTQNIVINPDPTTLAAILTLTPNITQVGNPLNYSIRVVDAYGNANTAALGRMSLTFSPVQATAPTCLPGTCAAPVPVVTNGTGAGTISFPAAGIIQVMASFSGTPAVVPASQFVSVINAPIPPTLNILQPLSTDVDPTSAGIPIQLQVGFNNATNNTITIISSGGINQTNIFPNVGQNICNPLPGALPIPLATCPATLTLNPNNVLNAVNQTVTVIATDGTTGATMTKSVTFQINPIKNIVTPGGRTPSAIAQGGLFGVPMGLNTYGVSNSLYVADSGSSTIWQFSLASTFPITPANNNVLSSGLSNPSDVQLRPNSGALGTYPPAAYQGLFVGTSNNNNFQVIDPTNTMITSFGGVTNVRTSYYMKPVTLAASIPAVLFAARPGNRVLVMDPVSGSDLTAAGGLTFNGNLSEPWGVVAAVNGTTSIRVFAANSGDNTVRVCDVGNNMPSNWAGNCNVTANLGVINNAGSSRLNQPRAMAFSASKKLYVVSQGRGEVLSYDLSTLTCAAGGCACPTAGCAETVVASGFNQPNGITFDAAGNMYVSDERFRMVVQVAPGATAF